jgi:hypothetical protein
MILREIVEHRHAGGRVDGEDVAAAAAILGRTLAQLRRVIVDQHRIAVFAEFEAAAEILPGEGRLRGEGKGKQPEQLAGVEARVTRCSHRDTSLLDFAFGKRNIV